MKLQRTNIDAEYVCTNCKRTKKYARKVQIPKCSCGEKIIKNEVGRCRRYNNWLIEVSNVESSLLKKPEIRPGIIKRRKKIYELTLRGESQDSMAKLYKITTRQVQRDIREARKLLSENWNKQTLLDKMTDYDESARFRRKKLHMIVLDKNTQEPDVIRSIKELRREDEASIKREQLSGILPKEASPLISISSESKEGDAENKVIINIISPQKKNESVERNCPDDEEN